MAAFDEFAGALPHHARAEAGVFETVNQTRVLGLGVRHSKGVEHGAGQRETFDALRSPVRANLGRRYPPHFLGVGLEKDPVEAPAKARGDPRFEVRLVLWWSQLRRHVGGDTPHGLDRAEVGQGVERLDGIVEEFAAVEDPTQSIPRKKVIVVEYLVPEGLDSRDLGEEAVTTDVKAPAVAFHGSTDAADLTVGLDDSGRDVALHQFPRGGEAGRSATDDDDVGCVDGHLVGQLRHRGARAIGLLVSLRHSLVARSSNPIISMRIIEISGW